MADEGGRGDARLPPLHRGRHGASSATERLPTGRSLPTSARATWTAPARSGPTRRRRTKRSTWTRRGNHPISALVPQMFSARICCTLQAMFLASGQRAEAAGRSARQAEDAPLVRQPTGDKPEDQTQVEAARNAYDASNPIAEAIIRAVKKASAHSRPRRPSAAKAEPIPAWA